MPPIRLPFCILALTAFIIVSNQDISAAELTFKPFLHLEHERNDNLFFDSSHADTVRDVIHVISPGVETGRRNETTDIRASAIVSRVIYDENDDLNATENTFSGNISHRFDERTGISTHASYIRDSRSDRDIESTGLIFGTEKRKQRECGISGDYLLTELLKMELSGSYRTDSSTENGYIDTQFSDINTGLSFNIGSFLPNTVSRMDIGYSRYRYADSTLEKVDNLVISLGLLTRFTETLSGSLTFGARKTYSWYDIPWWYTAIEDNYSKNGLVGRLQFSYSLETVQTELSFLHDLGMASGSSAVTERTTLSYEANKRFLSEATVGISAVYYHNKAREDEFSTEEIDEHTLNLRSYIRYELYRDVYISGFYRYTTFRDDIAKTRSRRNLFSLRLDLQTSLF